MQKTLKLYCVLIVLLLASSGIMAEDKLTISLKDNSVQTLILSDISKITFSNLTAIEENIENTSIVIYPNPVKNHLTIEFELKIESSATVKIFTQNGEMLKQFECRDCKVGKNQFVWDCLDAYGFRIADGVYFIEIATSKEKYTKKVILAKEGD